MPIRYKFYKLLRFLHLISKNKYKKRTARYRFMQSPDYQLMAHSKLFDAKWYLAHNPDVKQAGLDPVEHYLKFGWQEDRDCTPYFDGKQYLQMYPDVAASRLNPLLHWEKYGKTEGRDAVKMLKQEPVVAEVQPNYFDKIYHCFVRSKPFISIIVASYNYEDYIEETLKSLFKQTYKNFEIIIVDDGSSDNSVKVIKKLIKGHPNVFLYQHPNQENRGLPATVQFGVSKARGEYIAFCEADDFWAPEHLEQKVNIITRYANPKIIVNQVETFGDCVRECKIKEVLRNIYSKIHSTKMQVSYEMIKKQQYIPTFSCCMVKASVLKKCDFSAGGRPSALDWWLWRQILPTCCLFYLPQKLTYWRIHNSYNASQYVDIKVNQIMFDTKSDELYYKHNRPAAEHETIALLKNSGLFDVDYYTRNYHIPAKVNPYMHYLYDGWLKGYNPSKQFDGNKYLDFYQDVKSSGINPLMHYLKFGRQSRFAVNNNYAGADILILTTVRPQDGVYPWRCLFLEKFLEEQLNVSVSVESLAVPCKDILSKLFKAKLVIFNRPHNQGLSMQIVQYLHKHNVPSIMDVDDLLMEKYQHYSGRFKSKKISWSALSNNMFVQESCLVYFDKILVSTQKLLEIHGKEDKKIFLYNNKIDNNIIPKVQKSLSKRFRLLYASGSSTHDCDFNEVYIDVLNFLLKHDDVDLTILGDTSASFNFPSLKDRVVKLPLVSYNDMLHIYAKHDLLLIPLRDNLFNQSKSNIKYIEAAAVKTPVLAKSLYEFKSVIKDGVNGFLYTNDFYAKLEEIYKHKSSLKDVGKAAYEDCVKSRTIESIGSSQELLEQVREVVYA